MGVYEQKIKNSNKSIYDFSLVGQITGSYFSGVQILDTLDYIGKENFICRLPFSYFEMIPNSDTIHAIKLVKAKDIYDVNLNSIRTEIIKREELVYKINYREKYNMGSTLNCFFESYTFDEVKETADSLHLFNLTSTFKHKKKLDKISFQKGNIWLSENEENILSSINAEKLIEGVGDEVVYGGDTLAIDKKNLNIVCVKPYKFIPNKKIQISSFSNIGIFKPID